MTFDLDLLRVSGLGYSSPGIEGQGQTSKVKVKGRNTVVLHFYCPARLRAESRCTERWS